MIKANNVCVHFPKEQGNFIFRKEYQQILHDVSFTVAKGECLGILGESGSGKSTFLKCLYRVLQPNNGKIFFDGTEMSSLSHRDTALKMAVVAQHSTVNFDFSVLEMVLMGRSPYKGLLDRDQIDDYEIARHALAQVGLSDFESRNFNTLSGGEQNFTALAGVLAMQPRVLLLDEPTNGLDAKNITKLTALLRELQLPMLIASHDLRFSETLADSCLSLATDNDS